MTAQLARQIIPIIPSVPKYYSIAGERTPDYKALCCFAATGFFLDDDTHWLNQKAFRPASVYETHADGAISLKETYFNWFHQPRFLRFEEAVEEFTRLFEKIISTGTSSRKVILPISGGLDSRTLAAALRSHDHVRGYSYEFERGIPENQYGAAIAKACGFPFDARTIRHGYLWSKIEAGAGMNECFSEYTHPRQLAVLDELSGKGDQFVLGHWGDVLFDDMGMKGPYSTEELTASVQTKMIKRGGMELARKLWQSWALSGSFDEYFTQRISDLLNRISIDNANAKVRAFKSLHWAPRWTSTNLTFFAHYHDILVPYYDDEMCKLICTLPEEFLSGRKIQIAYLKNKAPELAAVPWQKFAPCNLYNYQNYYSWKRLPQRILKRLISEIAPPKNPIRRNWELQFSGDDNLQQLKQYLDDPSLSGYVGKEVSDFFYKSFLTTPLEAAHPVSMLLTLSLFARRNFH